MAQVLLSSRAVLATAAVLTAGALGGCGNGLSSSSAPDAGGSSAAVGSDSSSGSGSASRGTSSGSAAGSSAGSTDTAASPTTQGPRPCTASQLQVALDQPPGGAAAGSVYLVLAFTNKASVVCTMSGHPGVSFVGRGDGTQLGTSADREGGIRQVTLQRGDTTDAMVKVADAGDYDADACAPRTSDGLRVYPPDSRASVYLPYRTQACGAELGRGHSQLQVSAVGEAG